MENVRSDMLTSALHWLDLGAALLPAQHNTKKLAYGYGPNLKKVTTRRDAERVFGKGSKHNLVVIAPPGLLMLDFDHSELCGRWQEEIPSSYCLTYQETTPHGWRVFYWCDFRPGPGVKLVPGVEIKKFCLVAPSQLDGFIYSPIDPSLPILEVSDPSRILFPLLSGLLEPHTAHNLELGGATRPAIAGDVISRIKAAVPVLEIISIYSDVKQSRGLDNRWRTARCPFHDDQHSSMWVDTVRQLWGCHACGVHGDVINFYARINNLSIKEAIRALAEKHHV